VHRPSTLEDLCEI